MKIRMSSGGTFIQMLDLIHKDVPSLNRKLWKLKAPLKIKIFLWYLRKGVILTKDNLAKRNWQGSKKCCFCHKDETIKHLFFECRFARVVWSIIQLASGLSRPHSVSDINNLVFGKKHDLSPMRVTFKIIHWLRSWAILQRPTSRDIVVAASQHLAHPLKIEGPLSILSGGRPFVPNPHAIDAPLPRPPRPAVPGRHRAARPRAPGRASPDRRAGPSRRPDAPSPPHRPHAALPGARPSPAAAPPRLAYETWSFHGEKETRVKTEGEADDDLACVDRMDEMLEALQPEFGLNSEDPPTKEFEEFFKLLQALEEPLHEHTKVSLLAFVTRLIANKSKYFFLDNYFNDLVQLIGDILPQPHKLPNDMYQCKRLTKALASASASSPYYFKPGERVSAYLYMYANMKEMDPYFKEFQRQNWTSKKQPTSKQLDKMRRHGIDGKPNFSDWFKIYVQASSKAVRGKDDLKQREAFQGSTSTGSRRETLLRCVDQTCREFLLPFKEMRARRIRRMRRLRVRMLEIGRRMRRLKMGRRMLKLTRT
ncbi:hypothetical protein U9M48_013790 [Paspalum notatum var. saurae]|uniref:Reverse transcriptase zinc-binding domain-containing protein n=1 Tax=Paspalum notatum var. saurae TaxID=547442 RepID=A0AAQ3T149_PASNO